MALEQFQASAEFMRLSPAERTFVSKFAETGGNLDAAILAAYPAAKSQSLRVLRWRLKNSERVQVALSLFLGEPTAAQAESKVASDDIAIRTERDQILQEPMRLAELLGYDLPPENTLLFEALLDGDATDRLILWPRGSGKSSSVTVAIVFLILRNPNVKIFFATSDIDMAKRRLNQIADFFDQPTEKFRRLFPEFCGLKNRVRQEFTVRGRSDRAIADPTFSVNTARADSTGLHADWIFIDDLVTFANSQDEQMLEQTFQRLQLLRGLRTGSSARTVLTGTTYDPNDAYGRIRQAVEAENNSKWLVSVKSCWSYRCLNCNCKDVWHDHSTNRCRLCETEGRSCPCFAQGERDVLITEHRTRSGGVIGYTLDGLAHERSEASMGAKNFACQYENDPRPEAAKAWPRFTDEILEKFYGRAV